MHGINSVCASSHPPAAAVSFTLSQPRHGPQSFFLKKCSIKKKTQPVKQSMAGHTKSLWVADISKGWREEGIYRLLECQQHKSLSLIFPFLKALSHFHHLSGNLLLHCFIIFPFALFLSPTSEFPLIFHAEQFDYGFWFLVSCQIIPPGCHLPSSALSRYFLIQRHVLA